MEKPFLFVWKLCLVGACAYTHESYRRFFWILPLLTRELMANISAT